MSERRQGEQGGVNPRLIGGWGYIFAKATVDSAVSFFNVITYFIPDINLKNHLTSERMFTKIVNELIE